MQSDHKVSVIRRFSDRTHKEMETISGCQDNFSCNEAKNCFAIADGATQSFYSSIWSKLLVDYFCENRTHFFNFQLANFQLVNFLAH